MTCALLAGATLAGCSSSQGAAAQRGRLDPSGALLAGMSYTVSGKEFNEQLVLCQMTVAALQSAGASVTDKCGVVGTDQNRQNLLNGDADMYWEYTGTTWTNFLHRSDPPSSDTAALYQAVKQADGANKVTWLDPTPMNDSYAIAVNLRDAERLNVHSLSDMAAVLNAGVPDSGVCLEGEFSTRPDGWPLIESRYNFRSGPPNVQTLEVNSTYEPTSKGSPCVFGEVYKTDGRIKKLNLQVLTDDRNALPKYNAALNVRSDVYTRNPAIAQVINPLAGALTDNTMTMLDAQVVDGEQPRVVARNWMRDRGFITGAS